MVFSRKVVEISARLLINPLAPFPLAVMRGHQSKGIRAQIPASYTRYPTIARHRIQQGLHVPSRFMPRQLAISEGC